MNNSVENSTIRRRNFRPIIFISVLLVIIITIGIVLLNRKPAEPSKTDQPETVSTKNEDKKEEKAEEEKEEKVEEVPVEIKTEEEVVNGKTPVQQDQSQNAAGELTGVINYAESDGETLMIRVSIDQYLESGTCLLELTTPGDSFNLTDNIVPSASTSSCSFDISTDLLINGRYNIKVSITSGGKTGIVEGEVDV